MSWTVESRRRFDEAWDAANRSTLIVIGDSSLVGGMCAYKLYVNRNIHGTGARFADLAPPNSVYTRLTEGVYRVVLRENDVQNPGRMESNAIEIEIRDDEQITLRASLRDGQLFLSRAEHT